MFFSMPRHLHCETLLISVINKDRITFLLGKNIIFLVLMILSNTRNAVYFKLI